MAKSPDMPLGYLSPLMVIWETASVWSSIGSRWSRWWRVVWPSPPSLPSLCIAVCVSGNVCLNACMNACMNVSMNVCMNACLNVCTNERMNTCACVLMCANVCNCVFDQLINDNPLFSYLSVCSRLSVCPFPIRLQEVLQLQGNFPPPSRYPPEEKPKNPS